jgi:hypothetical protein
VVPVQLNSIVRDHTGAPLALTGGMWALNARGEVTNILGDYAEYWQVLTQGSFPPSYDLALSYFVHMEGCMVE